MKKKTDMDGAKEEKITKKKIMKKKIGAIYLVCSGISMCMGVSMYKGDLVIIRLGYFDVYGVSLVVGIIECVIGVLLWIAPPSGKKGKTDGETSGNNAPSNGRASASDKSSRKGSKNSSADIAANQTPVLRICPQCGRQQPEGLIFCAECGERLKQQ